MTIHTHTDGVFAPVDRDLCMERIAGGNETEVYRTDDRRLVIKIKSEQGATMEGALRGALALRAAADRFADCLGPEHSIRSDYLLARDDAGQVQVLVVQPFIAGARPLHAVSYRSLRPEERRRIADQLHEIVRRARRFYIKTGAMPDLYGRTSSSKAERLRLKQPHMLPQRLWSFLVQRNLLRSFNLLLTDAPERRIVLVDYDPVRRGALYRRIYYAVRLLLFLRDYVVIARMRRGRPLPQRETSS